MKHYYYTAIFILYISIGFALPRAAEAAINSPSTFTFNHFSQPQNRLWMSVEYLQWFFKDSPEPIPLVTSGSLLAPLPGALGQFGTHVLVGNKSIDIGNHSGGRFSLGYWLQDNNVFGIEGSYFFVASSKGQRSKSTNGLPGSQTLAVPIFDVSGFTTKKIPGESIYVLPGPLPTGPGFAGKFNLAITNRLQGAETNSLFKIYDADNLCLDVLAGLRWIQLNEGLKFDVQTSGVPGSPTAGQFFNSQDTFNAENNFFGMQLGFRTDYDSIKFFGQLSTKVALGYIHENVDIQGHTRTSNGTLFIPVSGFSNRSIHGGIFAQPNNIGEYNKNFFSNVDEVDLQLGYHLNKFVNLLASYNFIYISNTARPGDQLNRKINTTKTALANASRTSGNVIPEVGPSFPSFKFQNSSFWAQGVGIGIEMIC